MIETIVLSIILLVILTGLIFWVLNFDNDLMQKIALIVYGVCFVLIIVNLFIEIIKNAI